MVIMKPLKRDLSTWRNGRSTSTEQPFSSRVCQMSPPKGRRQKGWKEVGGRNKGIHLILRMWRKINGLLGPKRPKGQMAQSVQRAQRSQWAQWALWAQWARRAHWSQCAHSAKFGVIGLYWSHIQATFAVTSSKHSKLCHNPYSNSYNKSRCVVD